MAKFGESKFGEGQFGSPKGGAAGGINETDINTFSPKIYTPNDPSCVLDLDGRDISGSRIFDRSGKGNHGAITGAVIKPMNYGLPVLSFDGTDDVINCGNDNSLKMLTNDFSIEFWVKTNSKSSYPLVISKLGYDFRFDHATNKIYGHLRNEAAEYVQLLYTKALANGLWYHIVVTIKRSSYTLIYVNGVVESTTDISGLTGNLHNTNNLEISEFIDGQIPMVKILKRIIEPSEVSQRYNDIRHIYGI